MFSRGSRMTLLFAFIVLLGTTKNANSYRLDNLEELQHVDELRRAFSLAKGANSESVVPPPKDQVALMGRFIVNQADWTAIATISTRKDIVSQPIVNLKAVADGPLGNGTGTPYLFLTPWDFSVVDLASDNHASLLMTLAQGPYCKDKGMDPMDPRCPRIILTGQVVKVDESSSEHEVAKNAVYGRHPWLASVPDDHEFFFAKLDIGTIAVLDYFGPVSYVPVEEYYNPPALE